MGTSGRGTEVGGIHGEIVTVVAGDEAAAQFVTAVVPQCEGG